LLFGVGQFFSQRLDECFSCHDQILIGHWVHGHAGKLIFIDPADVFRLGIEQLMHGPVMAREIHDERFADLVGNAFVLQKQL